MAVQRGLADILSGGRQFITFEEGKPMTLLFIDWYEDLVAIREHYEPSLNPRYIKCPGRDAGCPLCAANPDKYPSLKIKFRVYDPTDQKVKLVSMAKTHIQKLNTEFNLDEIDPTQTFVKIHRSGKGATDTAYSAREAKGEFEMPNREELDMPDIEDEVRPHTPEQIQGFMDVLLNGGAQGSQASSGASAGGSADAGAANTRTGNADQSPGGRKLPF